MLDELDKEDFVYDYWNEKYKGTTYYRKNIRKPIGKYFYKNIRKFFDCADFNYPDGYDEIKSWEETVEVMNCDGAHRYDRAIAYILAKFRIPKYMKADIARIYSRWNSGHWAVYLGIKGYRRFRCRIFQ